MKLVTAPQNEAIMSNVGEIGEFRIRNSAKAFNILSSGLYANKIKAIVRELSCNAVDSHVAANRSDVPFDVHLPNTLEPWFAIRDSIGASNYRSYRAWQDNLSKEYTKMFEDAGLDKALAQQQATSMINKMAATKNYQNISRMYENQWIMDHPEDAKRILNSELNKPFNQRRLSLTQEQLRLLQSVG